MSSVRLAVARLAAVGLLAAGVCIAPVRAEPGFRSYEKAGSFDDIRDEVQDAILKRGLVIDSVGRFNEMLERTAEVSGSADKPSPYLHAQYLQFCPSKPTHALVNASPLAIANCPIAIFVYELRAQPGRVVVGYRMPLEAASPQSQAANSQLVTLLDAIVREAIK